MQFGAEMHFNCSFHINANMYFNFRVQFNEKHIPTLVSTFDVNIVAIDLNVPT